MTLQSCTSNRRPEVTAQDRGLHRPMRTEQILERLEEIAGQINARDTSVWILDDLEAEQRKLLAELRG